MRFSVLLFRVLPILAILFIQQHRGRSATIVSGNVSGIWSTNQSPYILSADCTVVSNQTLTIQPGVTVIIGPDIAWQVYGGILALGTPGQRITFQGTSPTNYWAGIGMSYSGFTNRFSHCRISEAKTLWASESMAETAR